MSTLSDPTDAGHTRGPWYVSGSINARYIVGIGDVYLIRRNETDDNRYVAFTLLDAMEFGSPVKTTAREQEANARLIAAAPDLLEALQGFMEADGHDDFEESQWAKARAAIHRATGDSHEHRPMRWMLAPR